MLEQLAQPSVNTILVKGHPGTGKSSLVLELLRMQRRGTYVSTRVSKENLAMHNPQVSLVVVGGVERDLRIAETKLDVEDYRLAGAEQIVKIVLRKISEEPGGLIVLDSWDAIAKQLSSTERLQTEKTMVSAIQASDSKLVFVSEEPAMTTTDFLVDAIVELELEMRNGYFRRWIETKKIRGQEISRPRRLFTLKGGQFRVLEPLDVRFPGQYEPGRYSGIEGATGRISSGVKDIDDLLQGGFVPGSTVCLDVGPGIPPYSLLPINLVIQANFISQGGCVCVVPSAGLSPLQVLGPLRAILPPKTVDSSVRVGFFEEYQDECTFKLNADSADESFKTIESTIEQLKGHAGRTCFIELGIDKLEYVLGEKQIIKHATLAMSRVRSWGDVLVSTVNDFTSSRRHISSVSDAHVLIESVNDVLTSQSLVPTSPIMGVRYEYSRGFPAVSFVPIV